VWEGFHELSGYPTVEEPTAASLKTAFEKTANGDINMNKLSYWTERAHQM
jgi:hypothetical protein